jgi:hypothetical protein
MARLLNRVKVTPGYTGVGEVVVGWPMTLRSEDESLKASHS